MTVLAGAVALALPLLATPSASAADLKPMPARMLEQMVLRAQMPKTLGAWEQNLYQVDASDAPVVCWSAKGSEVNLPKAPVGFVGYQVDQNTSGAIWVYQYPTQAKADAALAALRAYDCPDTAKHPDESEHLVKADQGTDFTDASRTGVGSGVVFTATDGTQNYVSVITTQVGLAVVQTTVSKVLPKPAALKAAQDLADRLSSVNKAWHSQALKAYRNFGLEGTAR